MIRICLRHGVELQRHAALLARGVVLVQDPLHGSLVNGDDGGLVGSGGLLAVTGDDSAVELLQGGL